MCHLRDALAAVSVSWFAVGNTLSVDDVMSCWGVSDELWLCRLGSAWSGVFVVVFVAVERHLRVCSSDYVLRMLLES